MEAPVFLFFSLSVGYLLYWTVVNDKLNPNGGYDGWFAIKRPPNTSPTSDDSQRHVHPKRR